MLYKGSSLSVRFCSITTQTPKCASLPPILAQNWTATASKGMCQLPETLMLPFDLAKGQ